MKRIAIMAALFALVASVVWVVTSTEAHADGWHSYRLKGARFTVQMPAPPQHRVDTRTTIVGKISTDILSAKNGSEVYAVSRTVLPGFATTFTSKDTIIDNAKGGLLEETFAKETSFKDVTRFGFKGKRLLYKTAATATQPSLDGWAEIYCENEFLVILNSMVPTGQTPPAKYFESIKPDESITKK